MKVKCIKGSLCKEVILGKIYRVLSESNGWYRIISESGSERSFRKSRFKKLIYKNSSVVR